MYINNSELDKIKQGMELIYYCDDLPPDKRTVLSMALTTIDNVEKRYARQKETTRVTQNERRKVRRASDGGSAYKKRFSVQVGEGTQWIYFNKPEELKDLLGVYIRNITHTGIQRELRKKLGRADIIVKVLDIYDYKSAKNKASKPKGWKPKVAGRKKKVRDVIDLPDFSVDNENDK